MVHQFKQKLKVRFARRTIFERHENALTVLATAIHNLFYLSARLQKKKGRFDETSLQK